MSADNDPGASSKSDKTNSAKEVVEAWLKSNGVSLEFKVAARFLQRLHPGRTFSNVFHGRTYSYEDLEQHLVHAVVGNGVQVFGESALGALPWIFACATFAS
jgi:hypothetical protein